MPYTAINGRLLKDLLVMKYEVTHLVGDDLDKMDMFVFSLYRDVALTNATN